MDNTTIKSETYEVVKILLPERGTSFAFDPTSTRKPRKEKYTDSRMVKAMRLPDDADGNYKFKQLKIDKPMEWTLPSKAFHKKVADGLLVPVGIVSKDELASYLK